MTDQREDPAEGESDGSRRDKREERGEREFRDFIQNFYGSVNARDGLFGVGMGEDEARPRRIGRFEERDVGEILQGYARPMAFGDAVKVLRAERVIILTGPDGSGRRTSAIALLHEVTDGPIVALTPSITTSELADRSFDKGSGYLIPGKFHEDLNPDLAEFTWRNVHNKVREARAYLVVTAGGNRTARAWPGGITSFAWLRPGAADALRAHLDDASCPDELIAAVADALGPEYPVTRISGLARRMAAGESADSLLAEMTDARRQQVAGWLSGTSALSEVLEVVALAFIGKVAERVFEQLLARLAERLPETPERPDEEGDGTGTGDPSTGASPAPPPPPSWQRRRERERHPLITVEREAPAWGSGPAALRFVTFRVLEYRALVIDELWNLADEELWEPVRIWLHALIVEGDDDLNVALAAGIALLARCAPDEVLEAYLDPWADGLAGWAGRSTAAYVLWWMSMDSTAPLALQTAIRWAGEGTAYQRDTAVIAFGGELGAQFPTEAVRRLCQLGDQGQAAAGRALAQLFATLADEPGAIAVLGTLRHRLTSTPRRRTNEGRRERYLDWAQEVLRVQDPRTGSLAVTVFLDPKSPDQDQGRLDYLAGAWAALLCARPWRRDALTTLWNVLGDLAAGTGDPGGRARALGAAICRELGEVRESEPGYLRADLPRARHFPNARKNVPDSIVESFLTDCVARSSP
jgi:hypothetical protein